MKHLICLSFLLLIPLFLTGMEKNPLSATTKYDLEQGREDHDLAPKSPQLNITTKHFLSKKMALCGLYMFLTIFSWSAFTFYAFALMDNNIKSPVLPIGLALSAASGSLATNRTYKYFDQMVKQKSVNTKELPAHDAF